MPEFAAETSSNIYWARYDDSTRTLEIDFRSNGEKKSTYRYENFPAEAWAQFNAALSKGMFFAKEIRPRYTGVKIWPVS